jgi:SAM-dependent methyltransferase
MRPTSPSASRNASPILAILKGVLPRPARVLEVASGTGQHARFFADAMPYVAWQPTELSDPQLESIEAWREDGPANLAPALQLDVMARWDHTDLDAIVAINMVHISPWEASLALLRASRRALKSGGILFLYGPYSVGGAHTAPSNTAFDADLRRRDPAWGIRDVDDIRLQARRFALTMDQPIPMPANNFCLILRRR